MWQTQYFVSEQLIEESRLHERHLFVAKNEASENKVWTNIKLPYGSERILWARVQMPSKQTVIQEARINPLHSKLLWNQHLWSHDDPMWFHWEAI